MHLAVSGGTREADALVHQTAADAQSARLGLDQEQAQLADRLCRLDQKDASHTLAIALGDPAPLALGVEVIDESGDDAGHERLEVLVPAVLLGVQRAVPLDHPAHVAGAWLTQQAVAGARGRLAERELDGAHRLDQALLLGSGQVVEHGADLLTRAGLERRESGLATRREAQQLLAPVALGPPSLEQAAFEEAAQDAAQITQVQVELAGQLAGGGVLAVGQLVQHAHLGQREGTVQVVAPQDADAPGIQTIEAAHGIHGTLEVVSGVGGHWRDSCQCQAIS